MSQTSLEEAINIITLFDGLQAWKEIFIAARNNETPALEKLAIRIAAIPNSDTNTLLSSIKKDFIDYMVDNLWGNLWTKKKKIMKMFGVLMMK